MRKRFPRTLLLLGMLLVFFTGSCAAAEEAEIKTLQIPTSVTVIEKEAFAGSGVQALVITSGVQEIQSRAFANCKDLKDVILPQHDVVIADDAFDGCGDVQFHAFADTKNALWSLSHGFRTELIGGEDYLTQTSAMLKKFGIPDAGNLAGADDDFITCRLIVKMSDSKLADIAEFNPTNIVQASRNRYFIQFATESDTRLCYDHLVNNADALKIQFVEPDQYRRTLTDDVVTQQSMVAGWSTADPMGFEAYAKYVAEQDDGKTVVVAVLDSGFGSKGQYGSKLLTTKARSFTPDGNSWNYDGKLHGTVVATIIAKCTGDANVRILPLRITDAKGSIDDLAFIQALDYATQQGVDIINLSLLYEDENFDSAAVAEALGRTSATIVAAAGNHGGSAKNHLPANHARAIPVSAVDEGYERPAYSARDAEYAAPGAVSFLSSAPHQGTSFAAPQIAAAFALELLDDTHTRKDLQVACDRVKDTTNTYGMPILSRLARRSVGAIKINNVAQTLVYGDFFILECAVTPENATDKTFVCTSSDPSVLEVSVSSTGTIAIKAVGKGKATLTVTANDDASVSDSMEITVVKPVKTVTIKNGSSGTMYMNRSLTLTANVSPTDASNTGITWRSSNTKVATISDKGVVTPVGVGSVVFTAEAKDGYGASATYRLTIEERPPVSSIVITYGGSEESATVGVGSTVQLKATVSPADALQDITWKSLFPKIATIDQQGRVTAVSPGIATICAVSADGKVEGAWQLIVKDVAGSISITAPKSEINQGETLQLKATVLPEDAIDKSVVWTSLNPAVATVDSKGLVKGVSNGEAMIRATSASDSSVVANVTIRVYGVFTVTFDANASALADYGTPVLKTTSIQAKVDVPLGTLPTPTLNNHEFRGWYRDKAASGERMTAASSFDTNEPVTLYALWVQKPESAWVLESEVPSGARVTARSYSYREHTTSTSASMSGWTAEGSYWNKTASGSSNYATFPSGYDTSNKYYTSFAKSPYTAFDNGSTKREVVNAKAGYIYWHWSYNVQYASVTTRMISSKKGSFNKDGSAGGYYFGYFYAMASAVDCPYLDNGYCCSRYEKSYNCRSIINQFATAEDKTNSKSGLGSNRFFRFEYYTSTYTDYQKIYQYYRDLSYQPKDPGTGANITNKTVYVKYIPQ